jgi:hypothetical protein
MIVPSLFQFVTVDDVKILRDIGETLSCTSPAWIFLTCHLEQFYSTQIVRLFADVPARYWANVRLLQDEMPVNAAELI